MEIKEYWIFGFSWQKKRLRKHLINLQISMVHASTVAIIYSINELLEVSPGFILFKSPILGLENNEPIRESFVRVYKTKCQPVNIHETCGHLLMLAVSTLHNFTTWNWDKRFTNKISPKNKPYNSVKELSSVNKLNDNVYLCFARHNLCIRTENGNETNM